MYDVIIIGSGPAGLQASMALSRIRRPHLLISIRNEYRNNATDEMHTILTRDGCSPTEFRKIAREQIDGYGFAKFVDGKVVSTEKVGSGFEVKVEDGTKYDGRRLIIAMGAKDVFLPIEGTSCSISSVDVGFAELWGSDLAHCVFCHGYEHKDTVCAAIGIGNPREFQSAMSGYTVASSMQLFPNVESPDLVPAEMKGKLALLEVGGYAIMPFKKITKFSKDAAGKVVIRLSDGSEHKVDWILYKPPTKLSAPELVAQLGIELNPMGDIKLGMMGATNVPGVFAAGDCVNMLKDTTGAINEGFTAGAGAHISLVAEDLEIAKKASAK